MIFTRYLILVTVLLSFVNPFTADVLAQKTKANNKVKANVGMTKAKVKAKAREGHTKPKGLFKLAEKKTGHVDELKVANENGGKRREAEKSKKAPQKAKTLNEHVKAAKAKQEKAQGNRILPKRKDALHQKLLNPNAFHEEVANDNKPRLLEPITNGKGYQGAEKVLQQLNEPSHWFFNGMTGRLAAARFINRDSRNEGDFRYAYGQTSFRNFMKADRILKKIPMGELSAHLSIRLLSEINAVAFAEGGDSKTVQASKGLRDILFSGLKNKAGDLRNYQSFHYASKGLSRKEIKSIESHGAKFVKIPFTRKGWIVYKNHKKIASELTALVSRTKAELADGSLDPVVSAARFVQKFIALHPFVDGNGRTARLVMDRILQEHGILPPILKDIDNDIGLSRKAYASEILSGIARTGTFLGVQSAIVKGGKVVINAKELKGPAKFIEKTIDNAERMNNHVLEAGGIQGTASTSFVHHQGMPYALGADGFVYDLAGRPHLAGPDGNIHPLSQMTTYIMMRRISQHEDPAQMLHALTLGTRTAFAKLKKGAKQGPKIGSDLKVIESDGHLSVNVHGIDSKQLIALMDTSMLSDKALFVDPGSHGGPTMLMSRYQQLDLELWNVAKAFETKGETASLRQIEGLRDALFDRARSSLIAKINIQYTSDKNPMGMRHEYERMQYQYSPLRFKNRAGYVKEHGDSENILFRGENFAKWTGVQIDGIPFRPGLKAVAEMHAEKKGVIGFFELLNRVESDTVGTGVQSYTSDLKLLADTGFASSHQSTTASVKAMPLLMKLLVNTRIRDGETLSISKSTSLLSALFDRRSQTKAGYISIEGITPKDMKRIVTTTVGVGNELSEKLTKRISSVRSKAEAKTLLGMWGRFLKGPRRYHVKVGDIVENTAYMKNDIRNLRDMITVERNGGELHITAHRRANVIRVQKEKMIPGIQSLFGSYSNEQEVHVVAGVLPHRVTKIVSQAELLKELSSSKPKNDNVVPKPIVTQL